MTALPDIVVTAAGELVLQPERPDDSAFLQRLFVANNAGALRALGIAEPTLDHLMAMQFRAQTESYRQRFPNADYRIIERERRAIGRWISDDEGDAVLFVDVALLPEIQSRGVGAALTDAMIRRAIAGGKAPRASVRADNTVCLAMCRRLGLEVVGQDDVYVHLRGIRSAAPDR